MIQAKNQLPDEANYPHLAKFLRMGGILEVGDNYMVGSFANVRMENRILTVESTYCDLAAVLKAMDTQARNYFESAS